MHKSRGGAIATERTLRRVTRPLGKCRTCNKDIFMSRKSARHQAKILADNGHPRPYQCPVDPTMWHNGHIPDAVRHGVITREEWLTTRRPR